MDAGANRSRAVAAAPGSLIGDEFFEGQYASLVREIANIEPELTG